MAFVIGLLALAVGSIVLLTVRHRHAEQLALDEAGVRERLYDHALARESDLWMDWDAVEWWRFGVLWDDYDPLP